MGETMAKLPIPFHVHHVWKKVHFNDTLRVFRHLNLEMERAIALQWEAYRANPLRTEVWPSGDKSREVQFHAEFNSEAWDLDELVRTILPSMQRASLFLTIYGEIEHKFFELCREIAHFQKELPGIDTIETKDFPSMSRARGLEKAVRYLMDPKLVCLRSLVNGVWLDITHIRDLRHIFSHRNGRLLAKDRIEDFGSLKAHLSVLETGRFYSDTRFMLDAKFITCVLDTLDRFTHEVQEALIERYPLADE